jgi:hypothetical protein
MSSNFGGLQSYRCNEFGHLCGTPPAPPPHAAPATPVALNDCVSAENNGLTEIPLEINPVTGASDPTLGHLTTVAEFVAFIQSLKDDPNKITVAAIAGPPTPYVVDSFANPAADGELQPEVQHSCVQPGTDPPEYGDPAVRIKQAVDAFGANGRFLPICADNFATALSAIAGGIQVRIGVPCLAGNLVKLPNGSHDCQVTEWVEDISTRVRTATLLPECAPDAANAPCWSVFASPSCRGDLEFKVCFDSACQVPSPSSGYRNFRIACALRVN